jgi:hypothetical protein
MDIQRQFAARGLETVVDISLCGARLRNYVPSPGYGGASAVVSAISQMQTAGVRVARQVDWLP